MADGGRGLTVQVDRYPELLPPRPVRRRTILFPENAASNAYLLRSQVRSGSGCSDARGLLNDDDLKRSWRRMQNVLGGVDAAAYAAAQNPFPVTTIVAAEPSLNRPRKDGRLLDLLQQAAMQGEVMPYMKELAGMLRLQSGSAFEVLAGLNRLAEEGFIAIELAPMRGRRPREARIEVHHFGVIRTIGFDMETGAAIPPDSPAFRQKQISPPQKAMLLRDWPAGVPTESIRCALNRIPGRHFARGTALAVCAAGLGVVRPLGFCPVRDAMP